jgi:ABC-type transport system substrate-binding protein
VNFHDGSPFTAADVKWTFERLHNPEYGFMSTYAIPPSIKVEVVDDHTAIIGFDDPFGPLIAHLALPQCQILSKTYGETLEDPKLSYSRAPIGTGPFRFVEHVTGERTILEKNTDYWDPDRIPILDRVIILPIPDESARVFALDSGAVDWIEKVPPSEVNPLRMKGFDVVSLSGARQYYLTLVTIKPPTDNILVRHALNHAVDKQAISDTLFAGTAVWRSAPAAIGFGIYDQDPYEYNITKANMLLDQAGYPRGQDDIRFTLKCVTSYGRYPKMQEVTEAVVGYLSEVGVEVDLTVMEWGSYVDLFQSTVRDVFNGDKETPDYHMNFLGIAVSTNDADFFWSQYFWTPEPTLWNAGCYYNKTWEDLVYAGRSTGDQSERAEIYEEACEIFWEDASQLFLITGAVLHAYKPRVTGIQICSTGEFYFHDVDID